MAHGLASLVLIAVLSLFAKSIFRYFIYYMYIFEIINQCQLIM